MALMSMNAYLTPHQMSFNVSRHGLPAIILEEGMSLTRQKVNNA